MECIYCGKPCDDYVCESAECDRKLRDECHDIQDQLLKPIWMKCTICGVNEVLASDGYDTCDDCINKA